MYLVKPFFVKASKAQLLEKLFLRSGVALNQGGFWRSLAATNARPEPALGSASQKLQYRVPSLTPQVLSGLVKLQCKLSSHPLLLVLSTLAL